MASIFREHDIDTMNEDDVAGELVRPLCHALGYRQGDTKANLRSQIALQYNHAFLGHRNTKKDPPLRGRPDFVCEVVGFTRWVVEAKAPHIELTLEDSQQAHTYASHPEIGAEFYMLTNGRDFRLYRYGQPDTPLLSWAKDETDDKLMAIRNILGPDAMTKLVKRNFDLSKPLGQHIGSTAKIVSGEILYERTHSQIPLERTIDGMRGMVIGNHVTRADDGLIIAELDVKSPLEPFDALSRALGFYPIVFSSASEYISSDVAEPTLFQHVASVTMPEGTTVPNTLLSPGGGALPCDMHIDYYTEAVGFMERNRFKGTFFVNYDYAFPIYSRRFQMTQEGRFDILFSES